MQMCMQYMHVKDKIICNLAISAFDVNEFESDLNASNALNNYLIWKCQINFNVTLTRVRNSYGDYLMNDTA